MAKQERIVTPVGTVKFPQTDENESSLALVLDPKTEEFKKMVSKIEEEESKVDKKFRGKPHYKQHIDFVDGEKVPTDDVLIQFKSKFPLWDEKGSRVCDAKKNPIKEFPGWGSKVRVAFIVKPYDHKGKVGCTRYIAGIQVLDLRTQGMSPESCGFKEEDGFVFNQQSAVHEDMTPEEKQAAIEAGEIAWDE